MIIIYARLCMYASVILAISLPRAQRRKTVIRYKVDIIKSAKAAVKYTEVTISEAN